MALINSAVTAVKGDLSNKEGMRKEMEKADFKSVRGDFKFGNNHIPIQNFYLQDAAKNADGSYALHTVSPDRQGRSGQVPRQMSDEVIVARNVLQRRRSARACRRRICGRRPAGTAGA